MAERWELCFIADNSERVYRITLVNFRPVMFNIALEWRPAIRSERNFDPVHNRKA